MGHTVLAAPGTGDIAALTLAEAGPRLSDPGGMHGGVDLPRWYTPFCARRRSPAPVLTGPDVGVEAKV